MHIHRETHTHYFLCSKAAATVQTATPTTKKTLAGQFVQSQSTQLKPPSHTHCTECLSSNTLRALCPLCSPLAGGIYLSSLDAGHGACEGRDEEPVSPARRVIKCLADGATRAGEGDECPTPSSRTEKYGMPLKTMRLSADTSSFR